MGLRQNRLAIYRFKRLFGGKLTFLILKSNDHNLKTGSISRTYTQVDVKRAVIMPPSTERSFVYDLAYIASGKNFTHGGFFDQNRTTIMIDLADMPKDFQPKINNHIEFDGQRHEIKTIEVYPNTSSMIITTQSISTAETVGS